MLAHPVLNQKFCFSLFVNQFPRRYMALGITVGTGVFSKLYTRLRQPPEKVARNKEKFALLSAYKKKHHLRLTTLHMTAIQTLTLEPHLLVKSKVKPSKRFRRKRYRIKGLKIMPIHKDGWSKNPSSLSEVLPKV